MLLRYRAIKVLIMSLQAKRISKSYHVQVALDKATDIISDVDFDIDIDINKGRLSQDDYDSFKTKTINEDTLQDYNFVGKFLLSYLNTKRYYKYRCDEDGVSGWVNTPSWDEAWSVYNSYCFIKSYLEGLITDYFENPVQHGFKKTNFGLDLDLKDGTPIWFNEFSTNGLARFCVMTLNFKYWWEVRRFLPLWEQLRYKERPMRSLYNEQMVRNVAIIATTPKFNKLPIHVKKDMAENYGLLEMFLRDGNIWKQLMVYDAYKSIVPYNEMYRFNNMEGYLPYNLAVRLVKLYGKNKVKLMLASHCYQALKEGQNFWVEYNNLINNTTRHHKASVLCNMLSNSRTYKEYYFIYQMLCGGSYEVFCQIVKSMFEDDEDERDNISGLSVELLLQASLIPPTAVEAVLQTESWKHDSWGQKLIELVSTFKKQSAQWLNTNYKLGRNYHDCTYYLQGKYDSKLVQFLFKWVKQEISDLSKIVTHWSDLTDEEKALSFAPLMNIINSKVYAGVKHTEFAVECAKHGYSQSRFNKLQERFIKSQEVPDFLPDVEVEMNGYRAYFLPRSDVRGYFLGEYTNCCQHPEGVGSSCAYYGQEKANSGFLVVEKKGVIYAQSWTWINTQDSYLCFDNVEAKGIDNQSLFQAIYQEVANKLSDKFTVLMGTGLSDLQLSDNWQRLEQRCYLPSDYDGYTDAKTQVVLAFQSTVKA